MRKGLLPPLVSAQMEPGKRLFHVIHLEHPLALPLPLHEDHEQILHAYEHNLPEVAASRARAHAHWQQRVAALIPDSVAILNGIHDAPLRKLYCHGLDRLPDSPVLGSFVHFALWNELVEKVPVSDASYVQEFLEGFNVVGPIRKPHVRDPLITDLPMPPDELNRQALHLRAKVLRGVRSRGLEEHSRRVWDDAVQVDFGCQGPFLSEQEVCDHLLTDRWIPTPRFPLVQ